MDLDKEIARRAREDEVSRRLMTGPGIGPISATAIAALAPPAETFAKGRDFAAWLGLTRLQRSTGGKRTLGATSKMGERTLRRLLIIGSSTVVLQASKRGAPKGSWLEQMLARKPRMLVTVALANKMARIIWALLVKQETTELRSQPRREPGGPEVVASVVVEGGYGATVGETGPEEPDVLIVPGARFYDLVPVRELPYRPAAPSLHQRPDRWQHPTTCQSSSKTACAWRGVHR
jgi:transposase